MRDIEIETQVNDLMRQMGYIVRIDQRLQCEFNGYIYTEPFFCLCCHVKVEPIQWAYGRTCAYCDTGACALQHPHIDRNLYPGSRRGKNVNSK